MATVQTPPEIKLPTTLPVEQEQPDLNIMAFTMAALRLVNPWSVETETAQWQGKITPGSPEAKENIVTLAEVSMHDTPDDCWVVIYDRVYDISSFLDEVRISYLIFLLTSLIY